MTILQKSIFCYLLLTLQFVYGQSNAVSHGDYKAQLTLQKKYLATQVVNCKVFFLENEVDSPQLMGFETYDMYGKMTKNLAFEAGSEGIDTIVTEYRYDTQGRLSGYHISGNNMEEITGGYQYNDKNELTYYGVCCCGGERIFFYLQKRLINS